MKSVESVLRPEESTVAICVKEVDLEPVVKARRSYGW